MIDGEPRAFAASAECPHDDGAIKWNQWNKVFQCHKCGLIFVPYRYPSEEEVVAWVTTHGVPGALISSPFTSDNK